MTDTSDEDGRWREAHNALAAHGRTRIAGASEQELQALWQDYCIALDAATSADVSGLTGRTKAMTPPPFTIVSYEMSFTRTGPLYPENPPYVHRRTLTRLVDGYGTTIDCHTDEEAAEAIHEFINRPWVGDTVITVKRVTKITKTLFYEDASYLLSVDV